MNAAETSEPAKNMEHIYQCVAWMLSLASCNRVTFITHHNLYDVEAGTTLDKNRRGGKNVWKGGAHRIMLGIATFKMKIASLM